MRTPTLVLLLVAIAMAGSACGGSTCDAPVGCLRAGRVAGTCQCQEWETVRVETVPIKFVVVSVVYRGIGNATWLTYGWSLGSDTLPASASELGARFRAVFRSRVDGSERAALMANADLGAGFPGPLHLVTPGTADVLLAWGDGKGNGSANGFGSTLDAPGTSEDVVTVWTNPTLTVTTNYAGEKVATWSWTSVGGCFWPVQLDCEGPHFAAIPVQVLDGTRPPGDTYTAQFLATLTDAERTTILSYHPLYDPPSRDPATLASDPRFLPLGPAEVHEGGASWPSTTWTPCAGTLGDDHFEILHQAESPPSYNVGDVLVLQHSVLSKDAVCQAEKPGISLATSTPACSVSADVYLDRMFGTLLFVPGSVAPSCTRPAP